MKRRNLRLMALLLSLGILTMTGCKGTSDQPSTTNPSSGQTATSTKSNFNPTGFPIVNEKVTFRILTTYTPGNPPDFNDLEVMKKIEEKTNIHIEWILVPVDGYTEKRNLMLASGDLPDALGVTVPADELMRYGQQGVFIPMQDLVEKYAPNITALYDEIPNFKKYLTSPDGNMYGIARVNNGPWMITNGMGTINTQWLKKLGLNIPTTVDEFYNVLKAFKTQDPNGNGKADEIPFSFATRPIVNEGLTYIFGWFGVPLATNYLDAVNGKVISTAALPQFKEAVSFLGKLKAEGLMDPDYASQTAQQLDAKTNNPEGIIGYRQLWDINDVIGNKALNAQYEYIQPLKGPGGREPVFYKAPLAGIVRGAGVITKACKNPEALVRYFDYYFDQYVSMELNEGPIGLRVMKQDNGTYQVVPPPAGKSAAEWRFANAPTTLPLNLSEKFYRTTFKLPTTDKKVKFMDDYAVKYADNEPFMPVFYTPEESERIAAIQTDLISFIDRKVMEWIGNNKVEEEWDGYLKQLDKIGLQEYLKINQAAYDRFMKENK